jgi:hypothetical protein
VIAEYLEHYHRERNHPGLDNELIAGAAAMRTIGPVRRRARLGGLSTITRELRERTSADRRDSTCAMMDEIGSPAFSEENGGSIHMPAW